MIHNLVLGAVVSKLEGFWSHIFLVSSFLKLSFLPGLGLGLERIGGCILIFKFVSIKFLAWFLGFL
jgi:hypothetical protein